MIAVGMHVEIERSDGRIHGAVIAEVRKNGRYMVEWYEKGETKGKESTLQELLRLNPTLQVQKAPTPKTLQPVVSQNNHQSHQSRTNMMHFGNSDEEETFLLDGLKSNKDKTRSQAPLSQVVPPQSVVPQIAPAVGKRRETVYVKPNREPSPVEIIKPKQTPTEPQKPARLPSPKIERKMPEVVAQIAPKQATARVAPVMERRTPSPVLQIIPKRYPQQDVSTSSAHYTFAEMIKSYRTNIDYRPLTIYDQVNENRISVCVRKRPLNKKELTKGEVDVVTTPSKDIVVLHQPQVRVDLTKYLDNQKFRFDYTFDETATNEIVYRFTAQPLVKTIFENGTATCFAYGQTGSGKTHTMGGDFSGKKQNASMGIYALTARDVFKMLEQPQYRRKDLSVHCAFFEIYGSKVFDLLNEKNPLRVLEDQQQKIQVVGLKEEKAVNEYDVLELINKGSLVRTAGTTSANANSSRSHAVFQIILRQAKKIWGKFSLIDLAGNERGQDTRECDRETRQEGAAINTSLLALKECIRGMARNSSHVPFRQSKLTMVLRDSFIGEKSKTVMISMISPGISSSEHTLNTLRYADRVKEMGTDGGDSTPIRDEDLFLPPVVPNSDEDDDDDTVVERSREHRRIASNHVETVLKITRESMSLLSNDMNDTQKRDCQAKLDQLMQVVMKAKEAVENI